MYLSIKYHLVKNPMTYQNVLSLVEEVTVPAGNGFMKRYQHDPTAMNVKDL